MRTANGPLESPQPHTRVQFQGNDWVMQLNWEWDMKSNLGKLE